MSEQSEIRITDQEASSFAILAMSVGLPVGANAFMYFRKFISKKRAVELEAIQSTFTPAEVKLIRSKIPDKKSTKGATK